MSFDLFFEENAKPNQSLAGNTSDENVATTTNGNQESTPTSSNSYNYFSKSYKKLVLSRLFVEEKEEEK